MKLNSDVYINKWIKGTYPPISTSHVSKNYGTDVEPYSSLWLASFLESAGDKIKEGVKILDYGCGSGRLANYLSKHLLDFTYYGLEKQKSRSDHGENSIKYAFDKLGHDSRINLGFINGDIDKKSIEECNIAMLLSIFTHITIEETESIILKLFPIINRGGSILFSMILGNSYNLIGENAYGFSGSYMLVNNTKKQVEDISSKFNCPIELKDTFLAEGGFLHSIFEMKK